MIRSETEAMSDRTVSSQPSTVVALALLNGNTGSVTGTNRGIVAPDTLTLGIHLENTTPLITNEKTTTIGMSLPLPAMIAKTPSLPLVVEQYRTRSRPQSTHQTLKV